MKIPIFQIDAFTSKMFAGNPAAVCPLDQWLSDELMQAIAMENQLSETAFFVPVENGYKLRWFTPTTEVELCGHATLASAHVLWAHLQCDADEITFHTLSGALQVTKSDQGLCLHFPNRPCETTLEQTPELLAALGIHETVGLSAFADKLVVELASEQAVQALQPDFNALSQLPFGIIYVTAKSDQFDFVCRVFAPTKGINEDPVTGSAYTTLGPYWSEKLGKTQLHAKQMSARGGEVRVNCLDNGVQIIGEAVTVMTGLFHLSNN